jgi:hypothetical protein
MRAPGIEKGKMGDVVDLYKINAELDFKNVEVGGGSGMRNSRRINHPRSCCINNRSIFQQRTVTWKWRF